MTIAEQQKEYSNQFAQLDWFEKYEFFLDLAGEMPALPDSDRRDENRVHGCQTNAWIIAEQKEGNIYYSVDSDALIVKGMLGLMADILSGHSPDEIVHADWFFWKTAGIAENLDAGRTNGIHAAHRRMCELAAVD